MGSIWAFFFLHKKGKMVFTCTPLTSRKRTRSKDFGVLEKLLGLFVEYKVVYFKKLFLVSLPLENCK